MMNCAKMNTVLLISSRKFANVYCHECPGPTEGEVLSVSEMAASPGRRGDVRLLVLA